MSDILEPLDPAVRVLVEAEKARPEPPASIGDDIINRVAMTLAFGQGRGIQPVSADSETTPETSAPSSAPAAPVAGRSNSATFLVSRGRPAALIFLAGLTVGAVGHAVIERLMQRKPPSSLAPPSPRPVAPSATPVTPAPASEAAVERKAEPPREQAAPEKSPIRPATRISPTAAPRARLESSGKPAAERKLIEMARTALARGRYDEALKCLRRHATQFSDGDLEEEREGLMVLALVGNGDGAEARARGQRFLERFPRSLFAEPVETALRAIP